MRDSWPWTERVREWLQCSVALAKVRRLHGPEADLQREAPMVGIRERQHRPDGKEGTLSAQRVGGMGSESFSVCTRETGTLSDSSMRPLKRRACSSTRKDGASMARHGPSQAR